MEFEAIFVDVDNTLVCSLIWDDFCYRFSNARRSNLAKMSPGELQEAVCGTDDKVVVARNHTYISRLRPGAKEFLKELKGFGVPVYCLSYGMTYFVHLVMDAHGLKPEFAGLYGRENYDEIPRLGTKALLIDDAGVEKPWVIEKLDALGALDSRPEAQIEVEQIVRVPPFYGDPGDKALLAEVLPQVREAMGA